MIRKRASYIALLLVTVFAITLLPFNALHEHEEDAHRMARVAGDESHRCALDQDFCQDLDACDSQHHTHVHAPHAKCFSCDFHFIKSYNAAAAPVMPVLNARLLGYRAFHLAYYDRYAYKPNNKGPPALV